MDLNVARAYTNNHCATHLDSIASLSFSDDVVVIGAVWKVDGVVVLAV